MPSFSQGRFNLEPSRKILGKRTPNIPVTPAHTAGVIIFAGFLDVKIPNVIAL
jgi:hypothetical protein